MAATQESFFFPFLHNSSESILKAKNSSEKKFFLPTSESMFSVGRFSEKEKLASESTSSSESVSTSEEKKDLWGPPAIDSNEKHFGGVDKSAFLALDLLSTPTPQAPQSRYDYRNERNAGSNLKSCDFTYTTMQRVGKGNDRNDRYGYTHTIEKAEGEFQTVDSKPLVKNRQQQHWLVHRKKMQMKQSAALFMEKSKEEEELKLGKKGKSEQKKQQLQQQQRNNRALNRHKAFSEWSVQPLPDWHVEADIPLSSLPRKNMDASKVSVKDIAWRGEIRNFNRQADKISPKNPVPLQPLSKDFDYYWVTTTDDSLIKDHLEQSDENIDVFATDSILACLMSAAQSRYSWHLHLMKFDGSILIDKANGSIVDLLTVNETANEPPLQDAENRLNRPAALGYEAVKINQNLRLQLLQSGEEGVDSVYEPAPFVEKGDRPNTVGYRYRVFSLPPISNAGNEEKSGGKKKGKHAGHDSDDESKNQFTRRSVNILARTEVHGRIPKSKEGGEKQEDNPYVYICALNEFEVKNQKNWKTQIENQKGALLATEVRNNACKIRKFVANAMMAGCNELRLGFVSRKNANDNENHSILSVQSYQTRELGNQIGLKAENAWAVVRYIVDLVAEKPDGRYVLLKDPLKPVMRLYSRPDDDDDEDEKPDQGAKKEKK